MKVDLDLYTDYVLCSFGQTSATGLSAMLDGLLSHDRVTDFLTLSTFDNKALCIPVGLSVVIKFWQSELKIKQRVWRAMVSKNELFRQMLHQAYQNAVPFSYVLGESWYTNGDNINAVLAIGKHYLVAVKSNLEVAWSTTDRANGKFIKISEINLPVGTLRKIYIRSVKQAIVICRDIFINTAEDAQRIRSDGSRGELLLLSTDVEQTYQQIITTYQKRWEVEDYHKSLKNNTSLEASPAHSMQTQSMHLFASICAFVKLEQLKLKEGINQFSLKARLYLKALKAAFEELLILSNSLFNFIWSLCT